MTDKPDGYYRMIGISAPADFWAASKEKRARIGGGCGAGKFGDLLVPDTIYGLRITFFCRIHDWMYHHGRTHEDKASADRTMFYNILRYIDYHTKFWPLRWLRHRRALKYYEAVQMFGGPAFWKNKHG